MKSPWATAETHPAIDSALRKRGLSVSAANDLLGRPSPPDWSIPYADKMITVYAKAHGWKGPASQSKPGMWPVGKTGVQIPVDGRSWISLDSWLRSHGSSLPERVAAVRGYSDVDFTREIVIAANEVVISKTGKRASHGTRNGLGLPRGKTWSGAFQWMVINGLDHNELLGCRHLPWSRKLIVGYILAYHKKTGKWPSSWSNVLIEGDTRSGALLTTLRENLNYGLAKLVDEVGGRHRPDDLSLGQIRSIIQTSLRRGENPNSKLKSEIPDHPGLKWQAIDAVLRRNFQTSIQRIRDELAPPVALFKLEEFQSNLQVEGLTSLPDYNRRWRAGELDERCPGNPRNAYGLPWRKIVGTSTMPYADFIEMINRVQRDLGRSLRREEYRRMHSERKLPPGSPAMPPNVYKKTWGEITDQKAIPSLRKIRAYCVSAGIDAWSRYKVAYLGGSLPKGFPSPAYLRTRDFTFTGSARATGARHHNVRISEAVIRQVHIEVARGEKTRQQIADALEVPLALVKAIRSGKHWSCRAGHA